MLTIRPPVISESPIQGRVRLSAEILENDTIKILWFDVDERYRDGLNDRSDAFVVGLLYWAMVYHHDIICEAPLTERLHYQITNFLCPVLEQYSTRIKAPSIQAPLSSAPLQTQEAVGSGCSGGIDSFHVITNHLAPQWPSLKLTHLTVFSVGHMYERTNDPETMKIVEAAEFRARKVADKLGFEFVNVRSNYNETFPQVLLWASVYSDMACVHVLGRLFGTYFYASEGSRLHNIKHAECSDAAHYNVLSLPNLSTPSLTLYSEGESVARWEKTRQVASLPLARDMLNVCCQELRNCGDSDGKTNRNCGICDKCQRTLLDLDALGLLKAFANVFDLEAYNKRGRRLALRFMLKRKLGDDPFMAFAWSHLHGDLTLSDWWAERKPLLRRFRNKFREFLFRSRNVPRFKDPRPKPKA